MPIEKKEAFHDAYVRLQNDPENAATGAVTAIQVNKEVWFEDTATPGLKMNPDLETVAADMQTAVGFIGPTDCAGMLALLAGRAVALGVLAPAIDAMSSGDQDALKLALDAAVAARV